MNDPSKRVRYQRHTGYKLTELGRSIVQAWHEYDANMKSKEDTQEHVLTLSNKAKIIFRIPKE